MKIIFLDIDGVLVTRKHQISIDYKVDKDGLPKFDLNVVNFINEIQKVTNSQIVVISTWRSTGLVNIKKIFKKRGIKNVFDITPIGFEYKSRSDEINHWIYLNDVESFVVIDDKDIDGLYNNLIRVDPEFGLTSSKKAIKILNGY